MAEKMALVEQTLTRTAERLGDITGPVMAHYYQLFPQALEAFEAHSQGDRSRLEGEMVERALYCLMYWFESPGEIEILLSGSVIHHNDTLQVPPSWYNELISATADTIIGTIPAKNTEELALWEELRSDLQEVIDDSSKLVSMPLTSATRATTSRA
jgi:hypothetical protein